MKYLSKKPFSSKAATREYLANFDETFGKKETPASPADSIFDYPCGTGETGNPCILPVGHVGKHYTQSEKAAFQASTARREDEKLDFLAGDLRTRAALGLGEPQICDTDEAVSAAKGREPLAEIDRQIVMIGLERKLKRSYLARQPLAITMEEIFSLLLLLEDLKSPAPKARDSLFLLESLSPPLRWHVDASDTFEGFFRRLFVPWVTVAGAALGGIKMIGRVPASQVQPGEILSARQFLGLFPSVNSAAQPRPKFE